MLSESADKLVGNDAFEGYAIDLIAEIAEILKFNYTFKWVDDGAYGYKNKETGEWNGLMGELLSQVKHWRDLENFKFQNLSNKEVKLEFKMLIFVGLLLHQVLFTSEISRICVKCWQFVLPLVTNQLLSTPLYFPNISHHFSRAPILFQLLLAQYLITISTSVFTNF